jgi:UrcA family protein
MNPIIARKPCGPARKSEPARKNGPAKRRALIAIAALAAALTANPGSATTVDDEVRRAVVHYSDLDLSRPEDAHRLYTRLRGAAREVCENLRSADLQSMQIYMQCMYKAVTDAVAKVQSAQVAAIASAQIQHLSKR